MGANDTQVGGDHYQSKDAAVGKCPHCGGPIQHWDWAQSLRGLEYAGTKYLGRWWLKDGLNSLKKVLHYTQKIIETNFPVRVKITFEDARPQMASVVLTCMDGCVLPKPHVGPCALKDQLDADALRDGKIVRAGAP